MNRRGFTLVEILVVMSIIALLMAISYPIFGSFLNMARHSATETTLAKCQNLMNQRQAAFARQMGRRGYLKQSAEWMLVHNTKNEPFVSMTLAQKKIATIKILEMRYFPQSPADLEWLWRFYRDNDPVTTWTNSQLVQMYPKLLNPDGTAVSGLTNQEILYAVLTDSSIGDTPDGTDSFLASEIAYGKETGLPYFVDAWKGSIRFWRYPTRLFKADGVTVADSDVQNAKIAFAGVPLFAGDPKADLARDPDDVLNLMLSVTDFEKTWHTPAAYHMPLLVSAGPDGDLGMGSPDSVDYRERLGLVLNVDAMSDNLFSASTKVGGK